MMFCLFTHKSTIFHYIKDRSVKNRIYKKKNKINQGILSHAKNIFLPFYKCVNDVRSLLVTIVMMIVLRFVQMTKANIHQFSEECKGRGCVPRADSLEVIFGEGP